MSETLVLSIILSMKNQISFITESCIFHLRRTSRKDWTKLSPHTSTGLGHLYNWLMQLRPVFLRPLYRLFNLLPVLHCAAKPIKNMLQENVIPTFNCELHWLPIQSHITYFLMYQVHINVSSSCFLTCYTSLRIMKFNHMVAKFITIKLWLQLSWIAVRAKVQARSILSKDGVKF